LYSSDEEYCSYKTLSIASGMTHDQLSKALHILIEKGLITKSIDTNDKRVTLYRIEEKGRQLTQTSDSLIANEIFEFFKRNIKIKSNQLSQEN
jgi:DNA-binding MarR family transcriptional regulator